MCANGHSPRALGAIEIFEIAGVNASVGSFGTGRFSCCGHSCGNNSYCNPEADRLSPVLNRLKAEGKPRPNAANVVILARYFFGFPFVFNNILGSFGQIHFSAPSDRARLHVSGDKNQGDGAGGVTGRGSRRRRRPGVAHDGYIMERAEIEI